MPQSKCECFGDSGLHASTHVPVGSHLEHCDLCGKPVPDGTYDVITAINITVATEKPQAMGKSESLAAKTSAPIETMEWLAVQFRDRANADPESNTLMDAAAVEASRDAFKKLIAAAERAAEWAEVSGIADSDPEPYTCLIAAINLANGHKPDAHAIMLETLADFASWEHTEGVTVEALANWMRERAQEAIDKAEGK